MPDLKQEANGFLSRLAKQIPLICSLKVLRFEGRVFYVTVDAVDPYPDTSKASCDSQTTVMAFENQSRY